MSKMELLGAVEAKNLPNWRGLKKRPLQELELQMVRGH